MLPNVKKRLLWSVTCVAFVLLLTIAASFVVTYWVRSQAARYLGVVVQLRIGTTYDVTVAQMRNAKIPMTLLGECADPSKGYPCAHADWRYRDRMQYAH